jgi:ligand-binding SRPBCC domain-containing protein
MQLHIKTSVGQNYLHVFEAFDEQLFRQLAPLYPRLKLLRFDGSLPGDLVEVELQTGLKSFRWTSRITDRSITDTEAYFVDEGQILPPPLKHWRHQHLVTRNGSGAIIHDIIEFSTNSEWLDRLLYPIMLGAFSMRKPVYRKVFGRV